jgi:hypothetical protein
MRRRLFPAVVGLGAGRVSSFRAAAAVAVVWKADDLGVLDGGRDGGGVVGDDEGLIILTCLRGTWTVPWGSPGGQLPS